MKIVLQMKIYKEEKKNINLFIFYHALNENNNH